MAIKNFGRFICLSVTYTIILLYSFGSMYTTIFFHGAVLSPQSVTDHSALKSLPVIVRPVDGLGNQLFQYSASYSIARRRNSDLYICLEEKDMASINQRKNLSFSHSFLALDRSYILDVFNIPQDKLLIIPEGEKECPLNKLPGNITSEQFSTFSDRDLMLNQISKDRVIQFDGYAESEMFFIDYKTELMDLFTLNISLDLSQELMETMRKINETESVAVHVRRGDFNRYKRTVPISYYLQAMQIMNIQMQQKLNTIPKNNVTFFVFSDDIESVEKEFKELLKNENFEIIYCSNANYSRVVDFYLMTQCKNNIIANSTFSWWAAYLNRNIHKIVIAPLPKFNNRWYFKISKPYKDIFGAEWNYPADWITINPFI